MRIKLRKGLHEYELVSRNESGSVENLIHFHDKSSAQRFLYGFMDDPFNMTLMRYKLRESGLHTDISRLKDHDVLEQLAWQLSTGMISIVERYVQLPVWDDGYVYVEPEEDMPFDPQVEPEEEEKIKLVPFVEAEEPISLESSVEAEEPISLESSVEEEEPIAVEPFVDEEEAAA